MARRYLILSTRPVARSSHALEVKEDGLVRVPLSIDPLEPVAEANHDTPILKEIAQGRCRWVGRISENWELRDHMIQERYHDFVIALCVVRTTGEQRRQQKHRRWIILLITRTPDICHPDGLRRENEVDLRRGIMFQHAMEGHLSVP